MITFFAILFLGGFGEIPSEKKLKKIKSQTASLVFSADNSIIGKFFKENRTVVPYDSLPEQLINALIATEDARFYDHKGVDAKSLLRVLIKTIILSDERSGGGSTLSQQLSKNLYGRKDYGEISLLVNKLKEIILANRLENNYSKKEIIALYLNTVSFGENTYGIEVAAHRYFNKSALELNTEEAAILIGLLKANTYYNPRLHPEHSKFRRNVVLSQMEKYNYISKRKADSLKQLPISLNYSNLSKLESTAYFLTQVKSQSEKIIDAYNRKSKIQYHLEEDGLIIRTTLNYELHQHAVEGMKKQIKSMQQLLNRQYLTQPYLNQLNALSKRLADREKIFINDTTQKIRFLFQWDEEKLSHKFSVRDSIKHILKQLHAGVIGLDPRDGAIRAYVGGLSHQYYPYDQVMAKRQLASTFKPILYAAALEEGFKACDYLSNEEIVLTDYNDWSPKNYDKESGGEYSLAAALAFSKNIPTLRLFFQLEWQKLATLWTALGFEAELSQDPSVIYGTNSVNLLELAAAYSVFANGGFSINPYLIHSIENKNGEFLYQYEPSKNNQVLSKTTADGINEILNKAIREGTGAAIPNRYGIRNTFAGKTGTSQDYADAWFCIYNKEMVLVSRVGASFPSIHFASGAYGSGSRLALPVIGNTLVLEKNSSWISAGLSMSNEINCANFKEASQFEKLLNLFKNKESNLDQERSKSKKKKKRETFFNKLFGN